MNSNIALIFHALPPATSRDLGEATPAHVLGNRSTKLCSGHRSWSSMWLVQSFSAAAWTQPCSSRDVNGDALIHNSTHRPTDLCAQKQPSDPPPALFSHCLGEVLFPLPMNLPEVLPVSSPRGRPADFVPGWIMKQPNYSVPIPLSHGPIPSGPCPLT